MVSKGEAVLENTQIGKSSLESATLSLLERNTLSRSDTMTPHDTTPETPSSATGVIDGDTQQTYTTKELVELTGKSRNELRRLLEVSSDSGTFRRTQLGIDKYTPWVKVF